MRKLSIKSFGDVYNPASLLYGIFLGTTSKKTSLNVYILKPERSGLDGFDKRKEEDKVC